MEIERKNISLYIGLTTIILFFVCFGIRGCHEQKLIDESSSTCRAVIVEKINGSKGSISRFQFIVDGRKYIGVGGEVTTSIGDSVNVKYVPQDPSISTMLYSSEYNPAPPKHPVLTIVLIFAGLVIFGLILAFISYIKDERKKESEKWSNRQK